MTVSGMLNCSLSHALTPICCTCAMSAVVGPNAACSRKRAALRLGVPSPVPGLGGPTMFAVAVPVEDALALLVAPIVTLAGLGGVAGAVYSPVAEMVPRAALPPGMPFTPQATAGFAVLVTVAVNCWVAEGATFTGLGDTVTVIGGGAGG